MFPRKATGRKYILLGVCWPFCNLSSRVWVEGTSLDTTGARLDLAAPQSPSTASEQGEAQPPSGQPQLQGPLQVKALLRFSRCSRIGNTPAAGGTFPRRPLCQDVEAVCTPKPIRGFHLQCISFTWGVIFHLSLDHSSSGKGSPHCPPPAPPQLLSSLNSSEHRSFPSAQSHTFLCISRFSKDHKESSSSYSSPNQTSGSTRTERSHFPKTGTV